MNFLSNLKKNPYFKIFTNIYILILVPFVIWMLFFDDNSYLVHRKFDQEIKDLENTVSFYEKRLAEDKKTIKDLQDSLLLEKFAREKYLLKKENEDIYIIEFDTLKN
ncbi:FtsB family cell division protein [Polaribacter sargassicola]|uniref:FtsB family cell division protein n=1 Tax=Polaribacter sargassicola TaxID=2836891 RepID=UPI001F435CA0|nr:septum formation initiator family protein [Polaribacter sp. DS7-9]MCG1037403.1 septum formation initiator family protein [Polaribacter sp. DS7-9]